MWSGGGKICLFLLQSHNLHLPIKTPLTEFLLIYLKPENCADALHRKSTSFFNVKEGSVFHPLADYDFQSLFKILFSDSNQSRAIDYFSTIYLIFDSFFGRGSGKEALKICSESYVYFAEISLLWSCRIFT